MSIDANPYQAPAANLQSGEPFGGSQPVSRWRRFFGYLVDLILMEILLVIASRWGFTTVAMSHYQRGFSINSQASFLARAVVIVLFYLLFEGAFKRTPGKFICGTKVVDEDNRMPSFKKILGRSFARLIPFEGLVIFGAAKMTWHDKLSDTRVVRVK